ncbi:MAG: M56 family metallopeptidase [Lachnospiraceae bacterium]|nr:M56 family metallopeptidase [Lachnospiraceae bacterium]
MSLLQMSLFGSVIILVIIGLRALFLNRLPKKMFLALWWIALVRLLLPVSLPSSFSIYSLLPQAVSFVDEMESRIDKGAVKGGLNQQDKAAAEAGIGQSNEGTAKAGLEQAEDETVQTELEQAKDETVQTELEQAKDEIVQTGLEQAEDEIVQTGLGQTNEGLAEAGFGQLNEGTAEEELEQSSQEIAVLAESVEKSSRGSGTPFWRILWLAGMTVTAFFFLTAYIRGYKRFQISFPIEEESRASQSITKWQQSHRIRRTIAVRWSEYVLTPLTYGVIRPVILMPKDMDWNDERQLFYVLEHEFVHIRRFDLAVKMLLTAALCIHWFNPLVWIMYSLFNRDLEISCDDEVIRHFGESEKSGYARALIFMEEKKAGLTPLYNGFSKNAIEERIGAVMKIRKTSMIALLTAVILVCGVLLGFATTAKEKNADQGEYLEEVLQEALEGSFSKKECRMLADLWVEDYENMPVSEYQERLWTMTDTPEYQEVIERFSQTEWTFETDQKEGEVLEQYFHYFHYVFEPLCAERWMKREFDGALLCTEGNVYPMPTSDYLLRQNNALFEYVLTLNIEQPEQLTAGQYCDTYLQTVEDMTAVLKERTEAELADGKFMEWILNEKIHRITSDRSNEELRVTVDYVYQPLENEDLMQDQVQAQEETAELLRKQVEEELEHSLGIYQKFGLTWEIVPSMDSLFSMDVDVHLYWKGKEVRGIYDEERGEWFTFYTGNGHYSSDAVELHVVYKDGTLAGLREADEKEASIWTQMREQNMQEREEDRYSPAGKEEYDSLLTLMKPDYKSMSVADFDEALLDWCNENFDSMERIAEDGAQGIWAEALSDEEKSFIELTFGLSREENHRLINNLRSDRPQDEKDVRYGWINSSFYKESEDGLAFADLWYCFNWYITDREQLTVGQRDYAVREFMNEAEQIVQAMDLDELLTIEESELVSILKETAEKYSDGLIRIEIADDNVSVDRLDERGLMWERERY